MSVFVWMYSAWALPHGHTKLAVASVQNVSTTPISNSYCKPPWNTITVQWTLQLYSPQSQAHPTCKKSRSVSRIMNYHHQHTCQICNINIIQAMTSITLIKIRYTAMTLYGIAIYGLATLNNNSWSTSLVVIVIAITQTIHPTQGTYKYLHTHATPHAATIRMTLIVIHVNCCLHCLSLEALHQNSPLSSSPPSPVPPPLPPSPSAIAWHPSCSCHEEWDTWEAVRSEFGEGWKKESKAVTSALS